MVIEGGEGDFDFFRRRGALPSYPSHFLPVLEHRVQAGFVSSHFTRRILGFISLAPEFGS